MKTLNEIMRFSLGKNTTRINVQESNLYSPENFENDLYCVNACYEKSECIINLIKSKVAPLSKEKRG